MDLTEVMGTCDDLDIFEQRYNSDNFFEVVFFTKDESSWTSFLSQHLGAPQKPAGKAPSREHAELVEQFGGIRKNQTLFVKAIDSGTVVAMYWPWNDGEHITLRIAVVEG